MTDTFTALLQKRLPELELLQQEPMKLHTTFRIGGPADYYAAPSAAQLPELLACAREAGLPVTVIGNGSNLLVGDGGVRGLVAELGKAASQVKIEGTRLTAEAGTLLSRAASLAADAGLGGMEFAHGIPGSVGGAVVMNAGAYGGEIRDILISAEVLTPEGEILTLRGAELDLSYRHSCIPEKNYVVLSAVFGLTPAPKEEIRARMEDLKARRIAKQPLELPSAGSTFKRPEGYFAGKLIQDAGLRGYRVGGAQVSEKHCGFVVNVGEATASDVLQLIRDVQKIILEKDGVPMEPEVKMIGEF